MLKYQNPSSPLLIQRVNQSGANFVKGDDIYIKKRRPKYVEE